MENRGFSCETISYSYSRCDGKKGTQGGKGGDGGCAGLGGNSGNVAVVGLDEIPRVHILNGTGKSHYKCKNRLFNLN